MSEQLRALAARLDELSVPVDAESLLQAGVVPRQRPARVARVVLAAALVVIVVVAVALAGVAGDGGPDTSVVSPAPKPTTSTPTTLPSYAGTAWDELPTSGFAVIGDAETTLHDHDGTPLATVRQPALDEVLSGPTRSTIGVQRGEVLVAEDPDPAEAPAGCDEASAAGGLRVALCGGEPQVRDRIVAVAPDGATRAVAGPLDGRRGHWRWALPSPDGRWVLGQWSGECESPSAHLLHADGLAQREVAGGVESFGVGWAPDGSALVQLQPGVCGSGADVPGVYAVDPETGRQQLVLAVEGPGRAVPWRRVANESEADRIGGRAIAELGLEGCCGEPSLGGDGTMTGIVWQERRVAISAGAAPGLPLAGPVLSSAATTVAGGPATSGEQGGGPFLAVVCGRYTWTFTASIDPRPDQAALRAAADTVVRRLYCTIGPRPAP